jgi:hypothetical protein
MVDGSPPANCPLPSLSVRRIGDQVRRIQFFNDGGGQTHSPQLLQLNLPDLTLTLAEFDCPYRDPRPSVGGGEPRPPLPAVDGGTIP